MQKKSYFSLHTNRDCLIPHDYKKVILLLIVALTTSSGIISPTRSFAHAPQIFATIPAQKLEKSSSPIAQVVKVTPITQVAQLAIGEKKITPTPTLLPSLSVTEHRGAAKQIDEHTWTMSIQADNEMASPQDIWSALNTYRQKQGKQVLSWDEKLASYAQSRVDVYIMQGNTDKHAGFMDFMNNQDGFKKLGFNALGENSSYGYTLQGAHLIEDVYAGDKPHDDNQLSSDWSHVGIGVKGTATDLIFGGKKQ
ncbi:hypothetical protein BH11PAT1_BH11PAT1_0650 [soil metagenome]